MKPSLTLKKMLTATGACILITLFNVISYITSPIHLFTPRDFLTILYWIIVLVGWIVYFLERRKNR